MTADPVQLEIEKGVATVRLNQPEVRNALTHELRTAFRDVVGSLEFNEDVRCVVITGAGNHFMAGGDIRAMVERLKVDQIERRKLILEGIHLLHLPLFAIRRMGARLLAPLGGCRIFGLMRVIALALLRRVVLGGNWRSGWSRAHLVLICWASTRAVLVITVPRVT